MTRPTLREWLSDNDARTEQIKTLRQRAGLRTVHGAVRYELFGVQTWSDLTTRVAEAYNVLMQPTRERDAIGNALGVFGPFANYENMPSSVIARRTMLVDHWGDVSMRTVERLEEVGAQMLSQAIAESIDGQHVFRVLEARLAVGFEQAVHAAEWRGIDVPADLAERHDALMRELLDPAKRLVKNDD